MSYWTYVPGCECLRCCEHHDATCAEHREIMARYHAARDAHDADAELAALETDCACPSVAGVIPEHAAWAHPETPVRSR